MTSVLETLQFLAQPLNISRAIPKIYIDEWTFRIHYRTTTILLLLFSALLSLREYLGDHIKCVHMQEDLSDTPVIPRSVLETYCFISTTFTVPYERNQRYKIDRRLSTLVGGPGHIPGKNERKYHAYYQWVPFFLFFQALLFYSPHAFWKAHDSGKIKNLVQDLSMEKHILERSGKNEKCSTQIARYLVKAKGQHVGWATAYILAEFGNLVVVLGNMYLTDYFLGREFSSFGPKVLQLIDEDPESRIDPMTKVFPRVTKCNLNTFGPSGSIQKFDALCVLSSNILNEKIFTFLWFWFVVVAVITILSFMYRIAFLLSFGMRLRALGSAQDFPEKSQGKYVVAHIGRSDWLVLRFLRLNMDSVTFYKLIKSIHEELMQNGCGEFPAVENYKPARQT